MFRWTRCANPLAFTCFPHHHFSDTCSADSTGLLPCPFLRMSLAHGQQPAWFIPSLWRKRHTSDHSAQYQKAHGKVLGNHCNFVCNIKYNLTKKNLPKAFSFLSESLFSIAHNNLLGVFLSYWLQIRCCHCTHRKMLQCFKNNSMNVTYYCK